MDKNKAKTGKRLGDIESKEIIGHWKKDLGKKKEREKAWG